MQPICGVKIFILSMMHANLTPIAFLICAD